MPKDGSLMLLVVAFLAAVVGFAAAFFLSKRRVDELTRAAENRIAEVKSDLSNATAECKAIQEKLTEVLPLEGQVTILRESLEQKNAEKAAIGEAEKELRKTIADLRDDNQRLLGELDKQEALIAGREEALNAEKTKFQADRKVLEDSFASLSANALQKASESFLSMADEKFKNVREVSQKEIDQLLSPMKVTLSQLNEQTREIEKDRTETYTALKTQIQSLLNTTNGLSNALKRPEIRGSYGEEVLITIAEQAGLKQGIHFTLQDHKTTDDGGKRPDMTVHVGTAGKIVVDAKTIWSAYEQASSADDSTIRAERLRAHANQVRETINKLARKEYAKEYAGSLDMVLLFIPNEAAYHAAIREDSTLIGYGFEKNVILTSPITLFTLLKVVAEGIRKQAAFESALEIAKIGGDLYDGVATFMGHFEGIRKGIDSASKKYDEAMGSLNRNVLPKTTKLRKLGVKTSKQLPEGAQFQGLGVPKFEGDAQEVIQVSLPDDDEQTSEPDALF